MQPMLKQGIFFSLLVMAQLSFAQRRKNGFVWPDPVALQTTLGSPDSLGIWTENNLLEKEGYAWQMIPFAELAGNIDPEHDVFMG
jgi:hypothetical protein